MSYVDLRDEVGRVGGGRAAVVGVYVLGQDAGIYLQISMRRNVDADWEH